MKVFLAVALGLLCVVSHIQSDEITDKAKFMFFYGPSFDDHEVIQFDDIVNVPTHEKFVADRNTVLYIHGYREAPANESIHLIVDSYLQRNDHNVLILDWSGLAFGNYLLTAIPNAMTLGNRLADILLNLFSNGLDVNQFHLVAHSLGGQLAGRAGRQIVEKSNKSVQLPRITGLDPAFPGFFPGLFTSHLSKRDAKSVDIIHTDAGIYGQPIGTGTVDFWPNAGRTLQPGCPRRNYVFLSDNDLCSHRRSWRFWAESVSSPTPTFHSVPAGGWFLFRLGYIDTTKVINMGIDCPVGAVEGNYYLQTSAQLPFSRGMDGIHYTNNQ